MQQIYTTRVFCKGSKKRAIIIRIRIDLIVGSIRNVSRCLAKNMFYDISYQTSWHLKLTMKHILTKLYFRQFYMTRNLELHRSLVYKGSGSGSANFPDPDPYPGDQKDRIRIRNTGLNSYFFAYICRRSDDPLLATCLENDLFLLLYLNVYLFVPLSCVISAAPILDIIK